MAKRARPAQGRNSTKRKQKISAGGDNVNARGANRVRAASNNRPKQMYGNR